MEVLENGMCLGECNVLLMKPALWRKKNKTMGNIIYNACSVIILSTALLRLAIAVLILIDCRLW